VGAWRCPQCKKRIVVNGDLTESGASGDLILGDFAERLANLRMIHEDGHFAENLSKSLNGSSQLPSSVTPTIKSPSGREVMESMRPKPKKKKKKEGLLLFFDRKS
jgi:hypothetical protein